MKIKFYVQSLVLSLLSLTVVAQAPGGVTGNLKLWVKSDAGTSTTGTLLDTWTYINDGSKSFTSSGTDRPNLTPSVINFKPSVRFGGGINFMDGPTGVDAPIAAGDDDYSVIVVWQTNSVSTFQRIWSQRSTSPINADACSFATWDNTVPGPGVYGDETAISPFSHTVLRSYSISTWNLSQLNLLNQATSDLEIVDDRNISTGITVLNTDLNATPDGAALRNLSDATHRIGVSFDGTTAPLDGDIAEIIVYDASISGSERNKIFSYLAMKYGITIKINLTASDNTTVWDATANSTFNNSVFGLSRDNSVSGSELLVSQSNSIETGGGDGSGQSGEGNIVLSNPSSLDNLDFLQIGNDNAALTEETLSTDLPAFAIGSYRFTREWKVQHTGNVGTVDLTMDLNGLSVTGLGAYQYRLMVDADGDGDFTTGSVRLYTPFTLSGGILSFSNITLNTGEVFAFITQIGGVLLPVTWISFDAKQVNNDVVIDWKVENNGNASHYDVEHSTNGIDFEKIGTVSNNAANNAYSFVHRGAMSGMHYYRLHQFDFDGKNILSKVVSVKIKNADLITYLLNNPVTNSTANLVIQSTKSGYGLLELWTINGVKYNSKQQLINIGTTIIPIEMKNLPSGNYLIKLLVDNTLQTLQFVKL